MKIDLAIAGMGAVTPAGVGVDALFGPEPKPQMTRPLGGSAAEYPVLRVDLKNPTLVRWQKEPRLRRASPMTYFMTEAAAQALGDMPAADRAETGLIVALSAGCLLYTRKFFQGIVQDGQRTASPALFPETVFNSPGSHVASVLGLNGAVYALCGDESAWIGALKTAAVWLRRGRVRQVLVMGVEEFDPLVLDAYRSARWLKRPGFISSEGAAALLVRAAQPGDSVVLSAAHEAPPYRTRAEARFAAGQLFLRLDEDTRCHRTARRTWAEKLEEKATEGFPELSGETSSYLGYAVTASAAWETLRAARTLAAPRGIVPIWGMNHRFGRIDILRW
jgi:3-oxoacyl-[acyl-carrier-protein] synthase III